jgi:hypothetical protein
MVCLYLSSVRGQKASEKEVQEQIVPSSGQLTRQVDSTKKSAEVSGKSDD